MIFTLEQIKIKNDEYKKQGLVPTLDLFIEEYNDNTHAKDEEINWVICSRCGIKEEGEEKMVGDESYYLCEICNDDMNG
jgi:hypothetical protein